MFESGNRPGLEGAISYFVLQAKAPRCELQSRPSFGDEESSPLVVHIARGITGMRVGLERSIIRET
jgi:hypothetical protein